MTEFLCIHFFVKRRYANEMMRHFLQRPGFGLGRQKIEALINLKRVSAYDFGADLLSDISGQLGLSGGGGPNNEKYAPH